MMRIVTLAAVAALAAVPAQAGEIRVSLAGKSAEQLHQDIVSAARTVCLKATSQETFRVDAQRRCVEDSVAAALQQVDGDRLAELEDLRLAQN